MRRQETRNDLARNTSADRNGREESEVVDLQMSDDTLWTPLMPADANQSPPPPPSVLRGPVTKRTLSQLTPLRRHFAEDVSSPSSAKSYRRPVADRPPTESCRRPVADRPPTEPARGVGDRVSERCACCSGTKRVTASRGYTNIPESCQQQQQQQWRRQRRSRRLSSRNDDERVDRVVELNYKRSRSPSREGGEDRWRPKVRPSRKFFLRNRDDADRHVHETSRRRPDQVDVLWTMTAPSPDDTYEQFVERRDRWKAFIAEHHRAASPDECDGPVRGSTPLTTLFPSRRTYSVDTRKRQHVECLRRVEYAEPEAGNRSSYHEIYACGYAGGGGPTEEDTRETYGRRRRRD